MQHIIIGNGIAGISAAKAIREHDQTSEIYVFTNEYNPLGLYARKDLARRLGDITSPEDLLIESKQDLARQGIRLYYEEVARVFPKLNQVMLPHNQRFEYDHLLIAIGATPKLIDVPGLHFLGVHQIRNYQDYRLIDTWLPTLQQRGAVIIGGGILALDMAYALNKQGVPVTLVVREKYLGKPFISEAASLILERRLHGITLILGDEVSAFLSDDERVLDGVLLKSGRTIAAGMALNAIGVHPNTNWLQGAGIEIDEETGAIPVNTKMQTNLPNIYAAGNCAQVNGWIARNWLLSGEQGRVAGLNMVGQDVEFNPAIPGDLDTNIYDLPFAYFGKVTPTSWTWSDSENQFVQVFLTSQRVVGAVFLGKLVTHASAILECYHHALPTTPEALKKLISHEGI